MEANARYFDWLCTLTGLDISSHSPVNQTYTNLLQQLHAKPFQWSIALDDNRVGDGLDFRDIYALEDRRPELGECTFLELMLGLSDRMAFVMSEISDDMRHWFAQLVINLNLDRFTDDVYIQDFSTKSRIDDCLNTVQFRTYARNGQGGFFPLHTYSADQRQVELWYQMHAYAMERIPE